MTDETPLSRYRHALERAEAAAAKAPNLLPVCLTRDELQQWLQQEAAAASLWTEVFELDRRLRRLGQTLIDSSPLVDWRQSRQPPKAAWWWFLDQSGPLFNGQNWLWNSLTLTSLALSTSLVVDISARFLTGGADVVGAFSVIAQSLLTLLTAGGVLTQTGQMALEKSLAGLGIHRYRWRLVKLGLSSSLLLSLMGVYGMLPQLSAHFNRRGLEHYVTGVWAEAQYNYERAISLNPANANAHYNLGRLHEDLQQLESAQVSYQLAAQGGLAAAYNDLARLQIQTEQYAEAAVLLQHTLQMPMVQQDIDLQYALHKNLGWVRLQQGRYQEAEAALETAIALDEQYLATQADYRPQASAHCLMAELVELTKEPMAALPFWKICLTRATGLTLKEDAWIAMARDRINQQE